MPSAAMLCNENHLVRSSPWQPQQRPGEHPLHAAMQKDVTPEFSFYLPRKTQKGASHMVALAHERLVNQTRDEIPSNCILFCSYRSRLCPVCTAFTRNEPGMLSKSGRNMFEVCFAGTVLISTGQRKITLILVNGNYAWPEGGLTERDYAKLLFFLRHFFFAHNQLSGLLTKDEGCLF